MEVIRFYKVNEPFGNFSNFSQHPILLDKVIWPTSEHYFQASKFVAAELKEKIRALKTPMEAAIEGRNINNSICEDWEMIKDDVMLKALQAKFTQHPNLRLELLRTEDSIIIEHTRNDSYWGNGGDDSGKNRLGELLMLTRNNLKTISNDNSIVLPPWIAFPEISQFDLFWRMGLGENYMYNWSRYYLGLSLDDKFSYQKKFPTIEGWEEFYE
jgi:N-glycosidase YbiA